MQAESIDFAGGSKKDAAQKQAPNADSDFCEPEDDGDVPF